MKSTKSKYPILLYSRILVLPDEQTNRKTNGGIFLPDAYKPTQFKGTVVSVGMKVADLIQPGERVIYPPNEGDVVSIDGKEHLILSYDARIVIAPR